MMKHNYTGLKLNFQIAVAGFSKPKARLSMFHAVGHFMHTQKHMQNDKCISQDINTQYLNQNRNKQKQKNTAKY